MPQGSNVTLDAGGAFSGPAGNGISTEASPIDQPPNILENRNFPECPERADSEGRESSQTDEGQNAENVVCDNESIEDVSDSESEEELQREVSRPRKSLAERKKKSNKRRLQALEFFGYVGSFICKTR